jgi:NAD(P)-dependent dehydrogenase (short-subunit alcohol dehydrogenase family)
MISTAYTANGAIVYIASRDGAASERVAAELTSKGPGKAHAIPADLQKVQDIENLVAELTKRERKLDVLVNNSGANWGESYDTYPDSAWTKVLTLNLQRVFTLTQKCTPLLEAAAKEGGGGKENPARVIHIGSVDGLRVPTFDTFAYSASKAGLHHLSRVLSQHLGRRGITSNVLACGPFESQMMKFTLENFKDAIEGTVPLGRIGTPQDVAGACLFLSSRAGAYINGSTITVDGGSVHESKL